MFKYLTREQRVREFHETFGCMLDHPLSEGDEGIEDLESRRRLIREEGKEVLEAFDDMKVELALGRTPSPEHWAHLLKELTDLQYVLSGTVIAFKNLNLKEFDIAFNRTHASNMSNLGEDGKPIKQPNGKIVKGPNYKDPDLLDLIGS